MFFSKKISTNSECQFKFDFGEYPPKPLEPKKLNSQFDILSKDKVGIIFHAASRIFSLLFLTVVGKPPFHTSSQLMIIMINCITQMRKEILETKTDLIKNATHLKNSPFQYKFILFVLLVIACLPFMFLFIVYHFLRLCIRLLILAVSCRSNQAYGYFVKLTHTSSQVVVNTSALRKCKNSATRLARTISFESVVSHEHIHLLQYCYFPERDKFEYDSEKVNFLKSLFQDPENDFDVFSYFFQIDEMEARLHEVVLSYYRKYGELPLDEKGFIKLLIGCRGKAINAAKTDLLGKLENRPYKRQIEYDVRCEAEEHEMIFAIFHLTDAWAYLLKVLPVMYGNLLIIYGDTNRAKKYFDTVRSFELYNQLYGEIIIPA
jgi:hypothetical protein